jgi:branched-chain amino acid transport system permease protein
MTDAIYGIELLLTGLLIGIMYAMVGLGFVLIYKASGVFNFAQGAMTLFAALTLVGFIPLFGFWPALLLSGLVMLALAVVAERIVFRPFVGSPPLVVFMATVAFALILEGSAQIVWGAQPRGLSLGLPIDPIDLGGVFISKADLIAAAIAGMLVVALVIFFQRSQWGLALRAIPDDQLAALSVGVRLRQVWGIAWALAGIVALAAGALWGNRIGVHFGMSLIALKALPVLIVGGIDSLLGVIVAGMIVGACEALGEGFLGPLVGGGIQDVMAYVVALLFLLFRPQGLFGQTSVERL